MKKIIGIAIISVTLLMAENTIAQGTDKKIPKWISPNGYWVIENTLHNPKENIIRFYTNNNQLVYKETISGIKLKLQKKKVKMQLKEVLERSITDWANTQAVGENKDYVKAVLH